MAKAAVIHMPIPLFALARDMLYKALKRRNTIMPTMSNSRRKAIQAKQRKAANALKRAAKVAKKQHNAA